MRAQNFILMVLALGQGLLSPARAADFQTQNSVDLTSKAAVDAQEKVKAKAKEIDEKKTGSAVGEAYEASADYENDLAELKALKDQQNAANAAVEQATSRATALTSADAPSGNGIGGGGSEQLPTRLEPAKAAAAPNNTAVQAGEYKSKLPTDSSGTVLPGPPAPNSFVAPDGQSYTQVKTMADGDTPGTQARYYSNDGGETGYRVSGNGDVHHMEKMANGEYLLGVSQGSNASAAIGKIGAGDSSFTQFTPRTDVTNLSRQQFINAAPTSKVYSPDILTQLPSTATTIPPSGTAASGANASPVRGPASATKPTRAIIGYQWTGCDQGQCKRVPVYAP